MNFLLEALYSRCKEAPLKALLCSGEKCLNLFDTKEEVKALSEHLKDARVAAVLMDNSPQWLITDLALMNVEAVSVPLPLFFSAEQLSFAIKDSGADTVITDTPYVFENAYRIDHVACAGKKIYIHKVSNAKQVLPAGTFKITYTSGSTGKPKGVCLSLDAVKDVCLSLIEAVGKKNISNHLAALPLSVLLENIAGFYVTLLAGGTYYAPSLKSLGIYGSKSQGFGEIYESLKENNITTVILVPELLKGLTYYMELNNAKLPSLKFAAVGGSKAGKELLDKARFVGIPVYEGYGLSECSSVVALNTETNNKPGSVGKALPHLGIEIAKDGEIVINKTIFSGYIGKQIPNKNKKFHTGDIGKIDNDGYIHITGRKDNLIVTPYGRNISPEWLEEELEKESTIKNAIVCQSTAGSLFAIIVPSESAKSEKEVAKAIINTNFNLPDYANVTSFKVVEPFTAENGMIGPNGKPLRNKIIMTYIESYNKEAV